MLLWPVTPDGRWLPGSRKKPFVAHQHYVPPPFKPQRRDMKRQHAQGWPLSTYDEIGKSCMTVAVKACAKKKDAKSDMK
jgi:hypothetical protein